MTGAVLLCGVGSTSETGDRPRPTLLLNLLLIRLLHGRCLDYDYSVLGGIMPWRLGVEWSHVEKRVAIYKYVELFYYIIIFYLRLYALVDLGDIFSKPWLKTNDHTGVWAALRNVFHVRFFLWGGWVFFRREGIYLYVYRLTFSS